MPGRGAGFCLAGLVFSPRQLGFPYREFFIDSGKNRNPGILSCSNFIFWIENKKANIKLIFRRKQVKVGEKGIQREPFACQSIGITNIITSYSRMTNGFHCYQQHVTKHLNSELGVLTIAAMKTLKIHRVKNAWEALETITEDSHAVRQCIIIESVH